MAHMPMLTGGRAGMLTIRRTFDRVDQRKVPGPTWLLAVSLKPGDALKIADCWGSRGCFPIENPEDLGWLLGIIGGLFSTNTGNHMKEYTFLIQSALPRVSLSRSVSSSLCSCTSFVADHKISMRTTTKGNDFKRKSVHQTFCAIQRGAHDSISVRPLLWMDWQENTTLNDNRV